MHVKRSSTHCLAPTSHRMLLPLIYSMCDGPALHLTFGTIGNALLPMESIYKIRPRIVFEKNPLMVKLV